MKPKSRNQQLATLPRELTPLSNPTTHTIQRTLLARVWKGDVGAITNTTHPDHSNFVATFQEVGYAWCAGFLDGEGCISLASVRRNCGRGINYRARVTVPQNCKETLLAFRDLAGENCVFSQLPDRASYNRPVYQLLYDGVHASRLLHKLRPYLVRKAAEADVIFTYFRDGRVSEHFGSKGAPPEIWRIRESCYHALRCLK